MQMCVLSGNEKCSMVESVLLTGTSVSSEADSSTTTFPNVAVQSILMSIQSTCTLHVILNSCSFVIVIKSTNLMSIIGKTT